MAFDINNLEFEPVAQTRYMQRCKTVYKGTTIYWDTYFPRSFFSTADATDLFTVDRIVPENAVIEGATINAAYYTEEGFGMPDFDRLEDAIKYIDSL